MKNRRGNRFLKAYRSSFERKYANSAQVALMVKNPLANVGDIRDAGFIPGSGRSPAGGHGNHSSILAWRIPWTEEPGGL